MLILFVPNAFAKKPYKGKLAEQKSHLCSSEKPSAVFDSRKPVVDGGRGAFDSAKNHKRQRRKRQSITVKREKSQTPMS